MRHANTRVLGMLWPLPLQSPTPASPLISVISSRAEWRQGLHHRTRPAVITRGARGIAARGMRF